MLELRHVDASLSTSRAPEDVDLRFGETNPTGPWSFSFAEVRAAALESTNYFADAARAVDAWIGPGRDRDDPLVLLWLVARQDLVLQTVDVLTADGFVRQLSQSGTTRIAVHQCPSWLAEYLRERFPEVVSVSGGRLRTSTAGLRQKLRGLLRLFVTFVKLASVARLLWHVTSRRPTYLTVFPSLVKRVGRGRAGADVDVVLGPVEQALSRRAPHLRNLPVAVLHRSHLSRLRWPDIRHFLSIRSVSVEGLFAVTVLLRPHVLLDLLRRCWVGIRRISAELAARDAQGGDVLTRTLNSRLRALVWRRYLRAVLEMTLWNASLRLFAPRFLVMWGEYSQLQRTLTAACRRLRVPTFAVQHGTIWDHHPGYHFTSTVRDYVPLPTRTLVWGTKYRDILIRSSIYPEAAVTPIGNPRLDFYLPQPHPRTQARPGAGQGDLTVLFTCDWEIDPDFDRLVRELKDSRYRVFLIIKMHPHGGGHQGPYASTCRKHGFRNYQIVTEEYDLYALLERADVHVSRSSTVLTEASMLGVPNVTLAASSFLGREKQHISVNRPEFSSLDAALEAALALPATRRDEYRSFITRHALALDGRAGERAAQAIADGGLLD